MNATPGDPLTSRPAQRAFLRPLAWAASVAAAALAYQLWIGPRFVPALLSQEGMAFVKACIALLGVALFAGEAYARRRGRPLAEPAVRRAAGALAAAAVCVYLISIPGFSYHSWEFFHHYIGAKYQPELGYLRIYRCTAVAQSELGPASLTEVRLRRLRDLETNRRSATDAALADPNRCKARFSPQRWSAFKRDIAFFRAQTPDPLHWESIQEDHGYNAPPLWTAQGKLLALLIPATERGLSALACIDPLLLVGMFLALWWAFGWRILCTALLFWGTVLPGNEVFTAGAMLRQDWLFWTVLSACLARRRHHFLAGSALATASLLRVFPGLLFAGWLTAAIAYRLRHGRFLQAHVYSFAGALVAGGVLAVGSAGAAGPGAYGEFITRLRQYGDTPLTNEMGLPQVLAYRLEGRVARTVDFAQIDPYSRWITMQLEARERRKPLLDVLLIALAVLFLRVAARLRALWVAQALGLIWIAAAVSLPCYYYSVFLLSTVLGALHRRYERAALLAAAASAALVACPWPSVFWDDAYVLQSVLFIAFAVGLLLSFFKPRRPYAARAIAWSLKPHTAVGEKPNAETVMMIMMEANNQSPMKRPIPRWRPMVAATHSGRVRCGQMRKG